MGYSPWGCKRVGRDLGTKQQQQRVYIRNFSKLFLCSEECKVSDQVRSSEASALSEHFFTLFSAAGPSLHPLDF